MVGVQISWISQVGVGERSVTLAGLDSALPVGLECYLREAFGDQYLLPSVLAVAVLGGPVLPVVPVVFGDVCLYGRHCDGQGDRWLLGWGRRAEEWRCGLSGSWDRHSGLHRGRSRLRAGWEGCENYEGCPQG